MTNHRRQSNRCPVKGNKGRHFPSTLSKHKLRLQQLMAPLPFHQVIGRRPGTPLAKPVTRYVTVYDEPFKVLLPAHVPLYDGLRRWYPKLYDLAVLEDEEQVYDAPVGSYAEEKDEEFGYWDRLEYMEWMYD